MSGILNNVIQYGFAFLVPTRSIGTIYPDCAVEERHVDAITITQHPVERGANISDHFYRMPAEVILRWSWSNSSPQNALSGGLGQIALSAIGLGSESYVNDVYQSLLKLQRSGKPFDILTGKRRYRNMMLQTISVETSKQSEYALEVEAQCTEVILVSTSIGSIAPAASQTNPQQTGPLQTSGQQQPIETGAQASPIDRTVTQQPLAPL